MCFMNRRTLCIKIKVSFGLNKTHSNTVHYTSPNECHYPLCNTKGLARQLYGSSSTQMPDRSTLNDIQVREINCNIKHLQTAFQKWFFLENIKRFISIQTSQWLPNCLIILAVTSLLAIKSVCKYFWTIWIS